jgi:hypothetical protein
VFGIFKRNDKSSHRPGPHVQPQPQEASLPSEIVSFLSRRNEFNTPDLMINVLDSATSAKMTAGMQGMSVGKHLGLVVLDDANDSNPYCYITGGIAAGMVVHFNHDPEPKIEFESLDAFERFLRELRARNQQLGEVEISAPAHPNQVALAAVLSELARATEHEDTEFLICLYLPLLRGEHRQVLERLGAHENFFVREAVAEAIGSAQLPESGAIVRALVEDPHPQVRTAAMKASEVLKRGRRDA